MKGQCKQILDDSQSPELSVKAAKELSSQLNNLRQPESIDKLEIQYLLEKTKEVRKILKDEPGQDNSGSFYNTLHSFKNIPLAVQAHIVEIEEKIIEKCIDALKEAKLDENTKELLQDLEECRDRIKDKSVKKSLSIIESLILDRWQSYIPPTVKRQISSSLPESFPVEQVIIIEDQTVWLEPVKAAVIKNFPYLQDEVYCYRTYEEAWKVLSTLKESKGRSDEDEDTKKREPLDKLEQKWMQEENGLTRGEIELRRRRRKRSSLVILDLGLPKDKKELEADKSSRAWGKKLLLELRSYALNVRTILLTNHFDFLDDHKWAINQGIEPEDYIWKAERDYRLQVQERIKEVIKQQESGNEIEKYGNQIEIYEDTGSLAVIDGVEVRFRQPAYFRTFSTLCRYNRWPKTCKQIVSYLKKDYIEDNFYDEYNLNNIHDHIYRIRKDIQEAFNRVGKAVYPETIVKTVLEEFEKVKYQVRKDAKILHRETSQLVSSPCSVLVVENDVERWAKPVAAFLREDFGHEVEIATNVEEAVEKAVKFLPAIVCLDMHIPENRKKWEVDPLSGRAEAGLEALVKIREELGEPDLDVVVLTDLYDKDDLRADAVQKGIDINHWIAKDVNWKTNLAYAVWRLTRKFKLGIKIPVDDEIENMLLIRLKEQNPRVIYINDISITLSANKSKLIWALVGKNNIPVSRSKLIRAVYGEDIDDWPANEENALNSLISKSRKQIEKKMEKAGEQINAKRVIVEIGEGYMLRGLVSIQE